MSELVFAGERHEAGVAVLMVQSGRTRPLPLRLDLRSHSPTGFEWGYCGSGPAQLALALLAQAALHDDLALAAYQDYKREFVAKLDRDKAWVLPASQIRDWLRLWVGRALLRSDLTEVFPLEGGVS